MQSPADQLRAKFEAIAKLEEEAIELYKGLPAGSLDPDDDCDLVFCLSWYRWQQVCQTEHYCEFGEIEDSTMRDAQWADFE